MDSEHKDQSFIGAHSTSAQRGPRKLIKTDLYHLFFRSYTKLTVKETTGIYNHKTMFLSKQEKVKTKSKQRQMSLIHLVIGSS